MKSKITVLLLCFAIAKVHAQQSLTMAESIQLALKNNLQVKADEYVVQSYQQLQKTHSEIGKPSVTWMHGQYNSLNKDNNFTLAQTIPFPTVIAQQMKLGVAQTEGARWSLSVTKNELVYQVSSLYQQLAYLESLHQLLLSQDSLYSGFVKASALRYKTGESNLLEKTSAETQMLEIKNQLNQNEASIHIYKTQLQTLINTTDSITITDQLRRLSLPDGELSINANPILLLSKQQVVINKQNKKVEYGRFLPDITVGYFNQSLTGFQRINNDEVYFDRSKRFSGFQFGVAIPLWFVPQQGKAKAAYFNEMASQKKYEYEQVSLNNSLIQTQQELAKNKADLDYYERSALINASLILKQAQRAFQSGEIGYLEYLLAVKNAHTIRASHLASLNQYNQSIIRIQYFTGAN